MDILERYHAYLRKIDRQFRRAAAKHPGAVACRPGCFGCCVGLFEITTLDAALARRGMESLPRRLRSEIRARGRAIVKRLARGFPGDAAAMALDPEGGRRTDRFFEETGRVACPFLVPVEGNGSADPQKAANRDRWPHGFGCAIYDHRPHTCRTFGLALTDGGKVVSPACRLNFRGTQKPFVRDSSLPAYEPEDHRIAREGERAGFSVEEATILPAVAAGVWRIRSSRSGGAKRSRSRKRS